MKNERSNQINREINSVQTPNPRTFALRKRP